MAHFAEIDSNNKVIRVVVVDNSQEHRGQEFLANDLGLGGTWIQTSYNGLFRKNYAGSGMIYKEDIDAFINPQPFDSWVLNEEYGIWESPVPKPDDNKEYYWNEENQEWVERL